MELEEFTEAGGTIACPLECHVPQGQKLVQVSTAPMTLAVECPNKSGRWLRMVSPEVSS